MKNSYLCTIFIFSMFSCISVSMQNKDKTVREYDENVSYKKQSYSGTVTVNDNGRIIYIKGISGKICKIKEHEVIDRTEIYSRTFAKDDTINEIGLKANIGMLSSFIISPFLINSALKDKNSQVFDFNSSTVLTEKGGLLFSGGILMSFGIAVLVQDFRTIDTKKHIGEIDQVKNERTESCEEKPAAGVLVELIARGYAPGVQTLISGTTNDEGEFVGQVTEEEIFRLGSVYDLKVDGVSLGLTDSLFNTYIAIQQKNDAIQKQNEENQKRDEAENQKKEKELQVINYHALSSKEAIDGNCDSKRYAGLQQELGFIKLISDSFGIGTYILQTQNILTLDEKGESLKVSLGLVGEYHVIALAYEPIKLEVTDSRGKSLQTKSAIQTFLEQRAFVETRQLSANAGATIGIKATGLGCALITTYLKY